MAAAVSSMMTASPPSAASTAFTNGNTLSAAPRSARLQRQRFGCTPGSCRCDRCARAATQGSVGATGSSSQSSERWGRISMASCSWGAVTPVALAAIGRSLCRKSRRRFAAIAVKQRVILKARGGDDGEDDDDDDDEDEEEVSEKKKRPRLVPLQARAEPSEGGSSRGPSAPPPARGGGPSAPPGAGGGGSGGPRTHMGDCLGAAATSPAAMRIVKEENAYEAAFQLRDSLLATIGPKQHRMNSTRNGPYAKELCLLEHVIDTARPGEPKTVIAAIENYGEKALGVSSQWLKVAGGAKATVLKAGMGAARPGTSVLEIGAYCGYSDTRMASNFPGIRVIALEVDPVHVVVARNVVCLAGLSGRVDVWTGHSKDLIARLQARYGGDLVLSAVFMDQKGSRYEDDLELLEREDLINVGSMIIADNVLKPGAPLFLWRTLIGNTFETQIVTVGEFVMASEDWISVSCLTKMSALPKHLRPPPITVGTPKQRKPPCIYPRDFPEIFPDFEREADRYRARARKKRSVTFQEWAQFAEQLKLKMKPYGVIETAAAPLPTIGRAAGPRYSVGMPKRR